MDLNLKSFTQKCVRVWHVLRKPEKEEYWMVAKISAIGVLIIGAIGFLISLVIRQVIPH